MLTLDSPRPDEKAESTTVAMMLASAWASSSDTRPGKAKGLVEPFLVEFAHHTDCEFLPYLEDRIPHQK